MGKVKPVEIKGMTQVMKTINEKLDEIEGLTMKGLILSAIEIRRDMDTTNAPNLIPVDLGNLRSSFFIETSMPDEAKKQNMWTRPKFVGNKAEKMAMEHKQARADARKALGRAGKRLNGRPMLVMGFSANYAYWVHENIHHTFKRPGSGAKFFESSLKKNTNKIIKTVKDNIKITNSKP